MEPNHDPHLTEAWPSVDAETILAFWHEAGPQAWFARDEAFDSRFRNLAGNAHFAAARRQCDHWLDAPQTSLALVLLTDQFPRNCFRGTAHMFATDPLARFFADLALAARHDSAVDMSVRDFFFLPFMHSETLADQERSVALYRAAGSSNERYAIDHCEIIRRFGRFPHRNPVLGRVTTNEEAAFLAAGGFAG